MEYGEVEVILSKGAKSIWQQIKIRWPTKTKGGGLKFKPPSDLKQPRIALEYA